jgi:mannose-6-phosphate isomerase-like protein (cupin superfamily)
MPLVAGGARDAIRKREAIDVAPNDAIYIPAETAKYYVNDNR